MDFFEGVHNEIANNVLNSFQKEAVATNNEDIIDFAEIYFVLKSNESSMPFYLILENILQNGLNQNESIKKFLAKTVYCEYIYNCNMSNIEKNKELSIYENI